MSILSKVGNILNDLTGVNSARKAENEYTTQMWHAANEYNSPSAQLARMAEAGIDINPTAYALGANNLSNTTNAVSSAHGSPAGNPISTLMSVASGAMGIAGSLQALMNAGEMNTILHEQGINEMIRGNNLLSQGASIKVNNDIARHNLAIGQATNRPVGYTPTMTGDPLAYGSQVGEAVGNIIAGW